MLSGTLFAQTLEQDSLALVILYNSTDGVNWTNIWDLSTTIDSWFGVVVLSGRVASLSLESNNLIGTIPLELGNLTSLTKLWLYSNTITGSIPAELGNITSLKRLNLRSNMLSGSIPSELGNLTNLTDLDLNRNDLTGSIPIELGNLANLAGLNLRSNSLTGSIPAELGNLSKLTRLLLYDNLLSGSLPSEIGNLTDLRQLEIQSNSLSGPIPTEIGNLTKLFNVRFSSNEFTDIPDLSALTVLGNLWVDKNRLTFDDIELNIDVPSSIYQYTPQDSVLADIDTTLFAGSDLTLTRTVGGTANQYLWFKNGITISGPTSGTYTLNNIQVSDGAKYQVRITSTIATGLTLLSRSIFVTVIDTTAPAVPQNLTVAAAFGDSVQLVWDPNTESDLSYYKIFRNTISDSTAADSITFVSKPDTNYTDTTVDAGITYYYWASAVDNSGNESIMSIGDSAFTNAFPVWALPDTSFDEDDSLVIDLDDWVSDQNDLDSTLKIIVSGGSKISVSLDSVTHVIIFGADPDSSGFSEQFVLTATDPFGVSTDDTISVTVLPISDFPSKFTLITPLGDTLNTLFPTFRWNPSFVPDEGAVVAYEMSISLSKTMESPVYMEYITDTSHTITVPLSDDLKYYWVVSAIDTTVVEKIDYQTVIEPIFTNNCTSAGCHVTGNMGGGLNLEIGTSYGEITGLNTTSNAPLVIAENPAISPLIWKLEGVDDTGADVFGNRMPFGGQSLSQSIINKIRYWITEGANPSSGGAMKRATYSDTSSFLIDKQEPPELFSLIGPPDGSGIDSFRPVFNWERSIDPDPRDIVKYMLFILSASDTDSVVYVSVDIVDTTHQLSEDIPAGDFKWFVVALDSDEESLNTKSSEVFNLSITAVGIDNEVAGIPKEFALYQNYPNPFNPSTLIKYALPRSSNVSLVIYNLMGQEVIRWDEENVSPGLYEKTWDGRTLSGNPVSSGIYVYRIVAGDFLQTKKMILMK